MSWKLTTTRVTGLLYLGLAITGVVAFLFVREKIYVDGDTLATSVNLIDNESLARVGIAAELALVGFQALTAVWFYKLFRSKNSFAAGLITVFGMVNAVAILVASAMWLGALNTALASGAEMAATTQQLFDMHENIWLMSNLFFGLWLLPMGYMARLTKMPNGISWFLYAGGVGYVLAGFILILSTELTTLADVIVIPATVGEFWIIGYLLYKPKLEEG